MPPSLPQTSVACLIKSNIRATSRTAISCRTFTTTAQLSSIGPESPRFIEVPLPPQRFDRPVRDVRGKLPPPRNVFHRRSPNKLDEEFLSRTVPEPSPESLKKEPKDERVLWKRQMAESRRTNFREGVAALHERKVRQATAMAYRSNTKEADRRRRLHKPQREDERLTNPTVREAISKPQSGFVEDPDRAFRIAQMAERVKAKESEREVARRDALHTLYMHARSFITTEAQLDVEIEKIFVEKPFRNGVSVNSANIWDSYKTQPTVQEMLSKVNGTQKLAVDFHSGSGQVTGQRMKKIAEELTGGKMD